MKCDRMTSLHKRMADILIKVAGGLSVMGTSENTNLAP